MKEFIAIMIGIMVCSCNKGLHIPSDPVMKDLVGPVQLQADTTRIFLSDYFPYPEKIEKIETSEGLTAVKGENGEIFVFNKGGVIWGNMSCLYEGFEYDIPFASVVSNQDPSYLYTGEVSDDSVTIRSSFPVKEWAVYARNFEIPETYLRQSDSFSVTIALPRELKHLPPGFLRVWGIGEDRISKEMKLPLAEGGIVSDTAVINELLLSDSSLFSPDRPHQERFQALQKAICPHNGTDSARQQKFLQFATNNMAMSYGDSIPLRADKKIYAYMCSFFGQEYIVASNNSKEDITIHLKLPDRNRIRIFKSLFDNRFCYGNSGVIMDIPAKGTEIIYN